jgi:hypothetical protein
MMAVMILRPSGALETVGAFAFAEACEQADRWNRQHPRTDGRAVLVTPMDSDRLTRPRRRRAVERW